MVSYSIKHEFFPYVKSTWAMFSIKGHTITMKIYYSLTTLCLNRTLLGVYFMYSIMEVYQNSSFKYF